MIDNFKTIFKIALFPAAGIVMATPAMAQDQTCGAFYLPEEFVGRWEMVTGTGVVSDSGGGRVIPLTEEGRGPVQIALIDGQLWLETGYIDIQVHTSETDYEDASEDISSVVPMGAEFTAEDLSLLLGCEWQQLQPLSGGTWGETPYGEAVLYHVNTVVTAQTANGEPAGVLGVLRLLAGDFDVTMERTIVLTRMD